MHRVAFAICELWIILEIQHLYLSFVDVYNIRLRVASQRT